MNRWVGLLNLLQGSLFGIGATMLWPRWEPAAVVVILCAVAQLVAGVALLWKQHLTVVRWAALATVALGAVLVGMYVQACLHIIDAFGPMAQEMGKASLGTVLAAAPWVLGFPLWQGLSLWRVRHLAAVSAVVLAPVLWGQATTQPTDTWQADSSLAVEAAEVAWDRWHGQDTTLDAGLEDAVVLVTPWLQGTAGETVRGDGQLAAALDAALAKLPEPGPEHALVVDVGVRRYPRGTLVRAGTGGRLFADGGVSPAVGWRPDNMRRIQPVPNWWVPVLKSAKGVPAEFVSALVSADGALPLDDAWTPAPEVSPKALVEAALEGGRMLVRNMRDDGRFAYRVAGPSGRLQGGYNYPRHAGTTWFLARLAERTGDPDIGAAAERAMRFMDRETLRFDDGRWMVKDPGRKDGKVWVGTTALAVLAAVSHGDRIAEHWGRFVADSVDEEGQVRGELTIETQAFPPQPFNPYGAGQAALALASLVRAGYTEFEDVSERAFRFIDGDYAPGAAERLVTLDEHWMCLAALVGQEVHGILAGAPICRAYLENEQYRAPQPGSALLPRSGPSGGLAEAVVAGAYLYPDRPYRQQAIDYGWLFLKHAYRPTDTPFLGNPLALIGGFRDGLEDLDVQMDSVQHIGCALLGIEALLTGEIAPGALP